MPAFKPIKRQELIRFLKKAGFSDPMSGGNHQYMVKEKLKVWIPNPHQGDISKSLLAKILRQAKISKEEWENL
jgi:predicted RNA binding protein YcfA (HicA-like mRNA interferase family)